MPVGPAVLRQAARRCKLGLNRATPAGDEWVVKTQGNDLFLCGTQSPDNDLFLRSRRRGGDSCSPWTIFWRTSSECTDGARRKATSQPSPACPSHPPICASA